MNFKSLARTFIIAEIGVNHEGNPKTAEELIRLAAASGVDAVKFQTYTPERYISTVQPDRRARAARFCLPLDTLRELSSLAQSLGVIFFSTPLHAADVDFLGGIQPIFKISSGDLTYLDLIAHVAKKGKPIILSTGAGTENEIRAAIETITAHQPGIAERGGLILLHCVAAYPAPAEEANLANIRWLADKFNLPVGYSDHTLGIKAAELAVAAGAVAIEKHLTYRRANQTFHDHALSAEPAEMAELVRAIRDVETYLGRYERERSAAETELLFHLRRSIGAAVDIPPGTPVQREWLTWLRPAWGLPADQEKFVIGRKLKRLIPAGDLIRPEDVE